MKQSLFALSLTMISLSSYAADAATSASLLLKGIVPEVLSIAVTSETIASNLPLSTTQTNTKVATVQEKSNSKTGYKVTISSANQGKLVRTNGSEQFPYTLAYNGQTVGLGSPAVINNSTPAAVTVNRNVTISYTGVANELMVAGDYVDTLTFTIAAN